MKRLIATLALLAAPASAQASDSYAARYGSSESGALASVTIHLVDTGRGRVVRALQPRGEPDAVLAYTDEIGVRDAVYMGNQRALMFPGSKAAVALFQVMPGRSHRYSPSLFGLCTGKGALFVGLEPASGSIRPGVFDPTGALRLYVIEETFEPSRINFTLCRAIDLTPA